MLKTWYTGHRKIRPPSESTVGLGQFGTPLERMHREKFNMLLSICDLSAAGNWSFVPAGSRRAHASSAAMSRELLTPSCCAPGNFPLPDGSGKFGTPLERMRPANKRGSRDVATLPPFVAVVVVVVPTLATFGVLGAHAVSEIEAATTRAASTPERRCLEVLSRVTGADH